MILAWFGPALTTAQYGTEIDRIVDNGFDIVDFWFLDCKPCIAEITGFDLISSKFKGKPLKVLSFSLDGYDELNEKLLSKRLLNFQ